MLSFSEQQAEIAQQIGGLQQLLSVQKHRDPEAAGRTNDKLKELYRQLSAPAVNVPSVPVAEQPQMPAPDQGSSSVPDELDSNKGQINAKAFSVAARKRRHAVYMAKHPNAGKAANSDNGHTTKSFTRTVAKIGSMAIGFAMLFIPINKADIAQSWTANAGAVTQSSSQRSAPATAPLMEDYTPVAGLSLEVVNRLLPQFPSQPQRGQDRTTISISDLQVLER